MKTDRMLSDDELDLVAGGQVSQQDVTDGALLASGTVVAGTLGGVLFAALFLGTSLAGRISARVASKASE